MAERVWRAQTRACAGTSSGDEALALVMKKLAS
jgi:hypothetical protein